MALTIVVGYTGIPVYKMICLEDGHTSISVSAQGGECHHKAIVQDCCTPKHISAKPTESCCAVANNFFKLNETTEVYQTQSSTGHLLHSITLLFAPVSTYLTALTASEVKQYFSPPLLSRKQSTQSIIQVFLI